MNEQNFQQPTSAGFCPECGNPLTPGAPFCSNCGYAVPEVNTPQPNDVPQQNDIPQPDYIPQPNNIPQPNPAFVPDGYAVVPNPNPAPKKSKKKLIVILAVVLGVIIAAAVTVLVLINTHTICINHEWKEADCTTPKTCKYCDETEGKALGHDWSERTCTEDSVCKRCDEKGEKATGHTEGEWTVTTEATLMEKGVEELRCTECSESLESRSISKKEPKVEGESFNFNAEEFVEWMEGYGLEFDSKVDDWDESTGVAYFIIDPDGEVGIIELAYDDNGADGNVCSITVCFENASTSVAAIAVIGQYINSSFVAKSAVGNIAYGYSYSAAGMTAVSYMSDGGYTYSLLMPTQYYNSL